MFNDIIGNLVQLEGRWFQLHCGFSREIIWLLKTKKSILAGKLFHALDGKALYLEYFRTYKITIDA